MSVDLMWISLQFEFAFLLTNEDEQTTMASFAINIFDKVSVQIFFHA